MGLMEAIISALQDKLFQRGNRLAIKMLVLAPSSNDYRMQVYFSYVPP
jgi:hypothetical protein